MRVYILKGLRTVSVPRRETGAEFTFSFSIWKSYLLYVFF